MRLYHNRKGTYSDMTSATEVAPGSRSCQSRRSCDRTKPSGTRCEHGGIQCTLDEEQAAEQRQSQGADHRSDVEYPPPATTPPTSVHKVRKRNRPWLSCTRCHRLKIKCDQKEPCFRCSRSGAQCTYSQRAKQPHKKPPQPSKPASEEPYNQKVPFALTDDDPEFVVATWFLRKRGSTYYRAILNRMESLATSDRATPFAIAVKQHVKLHCSSDFALPSNYPFGSPGSVRYASLESIHKLLRSARTDLDTMVDGYFQAFHPSLPVLCELSFRARLVELREQLETADLIWLAQLLAVLGLGAYTIDFGTDAVSRGSATAAEFLYASEACLSKTTYMARPTTTAISTLCLMVVAKQATTATCWALDTCWNVMGFVVRLSMMMVLHKEWMPGYEDPAIVRERALRRRLWTMVVFLDTQMSARTGQQSLLPQGTTVLTACSTGFGDCWDTIIPRALPTVCHFLSRMNAHDGDIFSYEEVLIYDREITQLMHEATAFYENGIVRLTLDTFFRRALLTAHCQYALRPNAAVLYPVSYNATFETNLVLLNHYHQLSSISPHTHLLAQPYMLDFLAAAFTTCMMLLSPIECSSHSTNGENNGLSECRQTSLDALMRCMEILANHNSKVLCFSTGFRQLQAMYAITLKDYKSSTVPTV